MRTKTRIITVASLSVITVLFIFVFTISKKINTAQIKKELKESLVKIYPDSNIKIGDLNYSLGTSLRFYINDLVVQDNKNQEIHLKVDKLITKFPAYLVLSGKGSISINLEKVSSNISMQSFERIRNVISKEEIKIPTFFEENRIDIRIEDFQLLNKLKKITIPTYWKKIVFKNIRFKSSTAFEFLTQADIKLYNDELYSNIQVIGEVNFENLIFNKKMNSNIIIQFRDNKFKKSAIVIPNIINKFKIEPKGADQHYAEVDLKVDTLLELSFNSLTSNFENYSLKDIDFNLYNSSFIDEVLNNNFTELKISNLNLHLLGEVEIDDSLSVLKPIINYNSLSPSLINGLEFSHRGSLKGKVISSEVIVPLKDGKLVLNIESTLKTNKPSINSVSGQLLNIDLDRFDIIELIKKLSQKSDKFYESILKKLTAIETININSKDLKILDESFNFTIDKIKKKPRIKLESKSNGSIEMFKVKDSTSLIVEELDWRFIKRLIVIDLPFTAESFNLSLSKSKNLNFKIKINKPVLNSEFMESVDLIYKNINKKRSTKQFKSLYIEGSLDAYKINLDKVSLSEGRNFYINLTGNYNLNSNKVENLKGFLFDSKLKQKKISVFIEGAKLKESKDVLK